MRDHALIEALLSARALGGIDPEDEARLRAEMVGHGDCEECARLEREMAEAAERLAFALEPVPVSRELEERTLKLARAARPPAARLGAAAPEGRLPTRTRVPDRARRWVRPLVAAAAAIALFAGGWLAGFSTRGGTPSFPLGDGRVVTFQGAGTANLALIYRPGARGMYLVGSNIGRPLSGKTYELWLFRGQTPVRAGCFEPSGAGVVLWFVDAPLGAAHTAAITQEPTECPPAPTSEPLFTATL